MKIAALRSRFKLTWQFSWILSGLVDFGIVTTPFWKKKKKCRTKLMNNIIAAASELYLHDNHNHNSQLEGDHCITVTDRCFTNIMKLCCLNLTVYIVGGLSLHLGIYWKANCTWILQRMHICDALRPYLWASSMIAGWVSAWPLAKGQ